jgi:hypothetical protein
VLEDAAAGHRPDLQTDGVKGLQSIQGGGYRSAVCWKILLRKLLIGDQVTNFDPDEGYYEAIFFNQSLSL